MKRSYPMHCLFRSNLDDVKIMPLKPKMTNIMRVLGHEILYRKMKINFMSIRMGNVDYIITQKDNICRYQKCDFHLSIPFRIKLSYS